MQGPKIKSNRHLWSHKYFFSALLIMVFFGGCGVENLPQSDNQSGGESAVTLSGTVKDVVGKPLSGVEVSIVQSGASTITDQDGVFSFGSVELQGVVQFVVQGSEFSALSNELEFAATASALEVALTLGADSQLVQAAEAGGSNPSDPSEPGSPNPTATPESVPSTGYDSKGNTKDFGIPAPLIGNVSRGRQKWAERCAACHASLVGRNLNFSSLKRTIARPPMNITMRDSALADLVAYLRR